MVKSIPPTSFFVSLLKYMYYLFFGMLHVEKSSLLKIIGELIDV